MTEQFFQKLIQWIADDNVHRFYDTTEWRHLSARILRSDKYECQLCKARGRYTPAKLVHHVNHVRDYPSLALSEFYINADGVKERNLISVCKDCHETVCHPDRIRKPSNAGSCFPERWD